MARRNRTAGWVETTLASYVDPQVVRHILSTGREPLLSGVRREVTCLFADVRGFTRFAAAADPARVVALLDRFFSSACTIAIEHAGSIDKLIGDAVMVLFGLPERQADDEIRAVRAAAAMIGAFSAIAEEHAGARRPSLGLGAGIASGTAILANVGSSIRMDYTVVGAPINLAARLCAEARAREILCDPVAATALDRHADYGPVRWSRRRLRIKGVPGVLRPVVLTVGKQVAAHPVREHVDPVCGMKLAKGVRARRYRGRVYRFCSAACRERFDRTPSAFVANREGRGS